MSTSLQISGLHTILSLFSHCTVHISEFFQHPSDTVKIRESISEESIADIPVILTKYTFSRRYVNLDRKARCVREPKRPFVANQKQFFLPCSLQVYILNPVDATPAWHCLIDGDKHFQVTWNFGIPTKADWTFFDLNNILLFKPGIYQMLVTPRKKHWYDWAYYLDTPATLTWINANLYTKLVLQYSIRKEASVMYYVCPFCERRHSFALKLLARGKEFRVEYPQLTDLDNALQELQPVYGPNVDVCVRSLETLEEHMQKHIDNYRNRSTTTLRNYKRGTLLELVIIDIIFPNVSTSSLRPYEGFPEVPQVLLAHMNSHYVIMKEEGFTFITCSGVYLGSISFYGYISSYAKVSWICIFISGGAMAGFMYIAKYACKKDLGSDPLCMVITTLLEQGDNLAVNTKQLGFCYWACGAWILMSLILTNGYRGENITELTSPPKEILPTTFEDILSLNFTIFTIPRFETGIEWSVATDFGSLFEHKAKDTEIQSLSENYNRIIRQIHMPTNRKEKRKAFKKGFRNYYLKNVTDCDNSALMLWTDEIKGTYHNKIRMMLYQKESVHVDHVSIGKEEVLSSRRGWDFAGIPYPRKIQDRVGIITQSGIANVWESMRLFLNTKEDQTIVEKYRKPYVKPLTMYSNISVVFLVYAGTIALSVAAAVLEVILPRNLNIMSSIVSPLWRTFKTCELKTKVRVLLKRN